MKMQISLDDSLAKRIDDYADKNYMSRSGLISLACAQFLNSAEVVGVVKEMGVAINKIADMGGVDEDTQKQIEDLGRTMKFLVQQK